MSKMHYFSNKFSKIAKRSQSPLTFMLVTWSSVIGQTVVFQADDNEIEL